MFKNIKEEIENIIYTLKDEYEERRLKNWLKTCTSKWRLENLYLPTMKVLNAYEREEWRN